MFHGRMRPACGRMRVVDALAQRVVIVVACTLVTHSNLLARPARDLARGMIFLRRAGPIPMIDAVLEAISGRAGYTRESRAEDAQVVCGGCEARSGAPRPCIRSALGIRGARGKTRRECA